MTEMSMIGGFSQLSGQSEITNSGSSILYTDKLTHKTMENETTFHETRNQQLDYQSNILSPQKVCNNTRSTKNQDTCEIGIKEDILEEDMEDDKKNSQPKSLVTKRTSSQTLNVKYNDKKRSS